MRYKLDIYFKVIFAPFSFNFFKIGSASAFLIFLNKTTGAFSTISFASLTPRFNRALTSLTSTSFLAVSNPLSSISKISF